MFNQDLREFIQSLDAHAVRYLVVGGYAVAFHGEPHYTKDLDVWIELNPDNAARLVAALDEFGFGSLNLRAEDFLIPDQIIQLGYPPNRIDLLVSLLGVDFETCYAAKVETVIDGIAVNFIDLENLKKNKKATGRLQDQADLENLTSGRRKYGRRVKDR
jgi:predicted nucleotidyltransferase